MLQMSISEWKRFSSRKWKEQLESGLWRKTPPLDEMQKVRVNNMTQLDKLMHNTKEK